MRRPLALAAAAATSLVLAAIALGSPGTVVLVSGPNEKTAAGFPSEQINPAISADGRFVAFATKARNLSGIDRDSVEDVFVRDLKTNLTMLVSRAQGKRGAAGNGDSSNPSISADDRYVAFDSRGSNLSPADSLHSTSVFRYQLLP